MVDDFRSAVEEQLGSEEEASDEDDEMGPAEDFGIKLGVPIGLLSIYVLFIAETRVLSLSPEANDLFVVHSNGAEPFLYIATATLGVALVGGFVYPQITTDLYDDYRTDIAIGMIFAPAGVILLSFAAVLLEPVANHVLAGSIADAVLYLVIELIILAVLAVSSLGFLVVMIFFGIYLGIPSFIGAYTGCFIGELLQIEAT